MDVRSVELLKQFKLAQREAACLHLYRPFISLGRQRGHALKATSTLRLTSPHFDAKHLVVSFSASV
jgi:hypothetical protein